MNERTNYRTKQWQNRIKKNEQTNYWAKKKEEYKQNTDKTTKRLNKNK